MEAANKTLTDFYDDILNLDNQIKASGDSTGNAISNLRNEFAEFQQTIGQEINPEVKALSNSLTDVIKRFNDLVRMQKRVSLL